MIQEKINNGLQGIALAQLSKNQQDQIKQQEQDVINQANEKLKKAEDMAVAKSYVAKYMAENETKTNSKDMQTLNKNVEKGVNTNVTLNNINGLLETNVEDKISELTFDDESLKEESKDINHNYQKPLELQKGNNRKIRKSNEDVLKRAKTINSLKDDELKTYFANKAIGSIEASILAQSKVKDAKTSQTLQHEGFNKQYAMIKGKELTPERQELWDSIRGGK